MMEKVFVLASNNAHKLEEFRAIFGRLDLLVLSQREAGVSVEPEENGTSFAENAMIKARAVYDLCKQPTVADDSGLCVDALNGAPGIFSARYGGKNSDAERRALLLENMKDIPKARRGAHFTSAIACIIDDQTSFVVQGHVFGTIDTRETGENGFGYDSLFLPEHCGGKSFAMLSPAQKNKISHRARALEAFAREYKNLL